MSERKPTKADDLPREIARASFPVERSKLRELALAFKEDDAAWFDLEVAQAAGFAELPVPPTATVLVDHWRPGGASEAGTVLELDLERVLHGEVSWEFLSPIRVGDELTAISRLLGIDSREGKRGGSMRLFRVEIEYVDQEDRTVARRFDTIVERGSR